MLNCVLVFMLLFEIYSITLIMKAFIFQLVYSVIRIKDQSSFLSMSDHQLFKVLGADTMNMFGPSKTCYKHAAILLQSSLTNEMRLHQPVLKSLFTKNIIEKMLYLEEF